MKLKNQYIIRNVADKAVAIAIENGDGLTDGVITLNSTGAFIFGLVNEGADRNTIVARFFEEYDVTREEAADSVDSFLKNLLESGLAEE